MFGHRTKGTVAATPDRLPLVAGRSRRRAWSPVAVAAAVGAATSVQFLPATDASEFSPGTDTIPPTVTCSANPSSLKPPNHKLMAVTATVSVADSDSGPDGFHLVSVVSNQAQSGLVPGDVPNDIQWATTTTGQLRAERFGSTRIYTLSYEGADVAGNTATCHATVTVPQGNQ